MKTNDNSSSASPSRSSRTKESIPDCPPRLEPVFKKYQFKKASPPRDPRLYLTDDEMPYGRSASASPTPSPPISESNSSGKNLKDWKSWSKKPKS